MIKLNRVLPYILFALIMIGMGICFFAYPTALDDYWFLLDYRNGLDKSADGSVWSGLKYFWDYRMTVDNARVANLFGVLFLLLPHWVGALISTLMFGISVALICRVAGVRRDDCNSIALVLVLMIFGLPWQDSMFTQVYSFNYIWSTPLMLFVIYLFFKPINKGLIIISVILGALLGSWHEIFGLPVLIGFCFLLAIRRVPLRSDRIALILGIALGLLWLVLAPSWWTRVEADVDTSLSSKLSFVQLLYHFAGFIPFVLLTAICLCVKRWRNIATSNLVLFLLVCCIMIIPVQMMVVKARAGFPAYILSFVGIVYILRQILPTVFSGWKAQSRWIGYTCALLTCVHLYAADCEILRLNREIKNIERLSLSHTEEATTIFAPMTFDWQLSPLALKKGTFEYHPHGWHFSCFSQYNRMPMHDLVPLQLKDYRSGLGEKLPGNAHAYRYKGVIVAPHPGRDSTIIVSYGGEPRGCDLSAFKGADGQLYCFVYPYLHTWDFFREITDASVPGK